jgi:hypothetical protein
MNEYYLIKRVNRDYGREDISFMTLLVGMFVGFSLASPKVTTPFKFSTYEKAVKVARDYQKKHLNVEVDIVKCMVIEEKAGTLEIRSDLPAGLVK